MSSEPIDVLLVGLGAVGGVYAYVLEKSQRCRVTTITRSLYQSIQSHGLTINSRKYGRIENWKPHRLVRSAEEALDRNYKFIICCVKCLPDVEPTSSILAPFLLPYHQTSSGPAVNSHPPPTVALIQNGIGIEQEVAEAFPLVHIISCVTWIGANLIPPVSVPDKFADPGLQKTISLAGPVIEHGPQDKMVLGLYEGEGFALNYIKDPNPSDPGPCNQFAEGLLAEDRSPLLGDARTRKLKGGKQDAQLFADLLIAGGCECEALEFIQPARWAKNLWNASFSTMCTLSRMPVAQMIAPEVLPYTLPAIRRTMLEIIYVGRALGYRETHLPAKLVDEAINFTIQHYQSKPASKPAAESSTDPSDQRIDLQVSKSDIDKKIASQVVTNNDVFEDDDEEDGNPRSSVEIDNPSSDHVFKPSMLVDLELNRPMELEPIVGAVLDRARSKAIETPRLDLLYSALKVLQEQAVRQLASKLKTREDEKHLHFWAMRKPSIGGGGTSDSRQAWLDEVRRRARLGQDQIDPPGSSNLDSHHYEDERTFGTPPKPSISHKVTGKPLA